MKKSAAHRIRERITVKYARPKCDNYERRLQRTNEYCQEEEIKVILALNFEDYGKIFEQYTIFQQAYSCP